MGNKTERNQGFAERVARRMIELGYVQDNGEPHVTRWCKEKLGYLPQYMYAYLKGAEPKARALHHLAQDLGVDPWELLLGESVGLRVVRPKEQMSQTRPKS